MKGDIIGYVGQTGNAVEAIGTTFAPRDKSQRSLHRSSELCQRSYQLER